MRLLLDAGEGINCFLEGRLLAFRNVAITHAHTDHFTGLQNILITRLREREVTGSSMPPLYVYYPEDSSTLERYFAYLSDVIDAWHELVCLQPMKPGDCLPLQGVRNLYLTAIRAKHQVGHQCSLSYRIEQKRWSLRQDVQDKPQAEINKIIAMHGRESVTDVIMRPLVYYSGDGSPLYDPVSQNTYLHIQEATFLESLPGVDHASLPEAIDLFRKLQAQSLLLCHLSTRYGLKEFLDLLEQLTPDPAEHSKIWVVKPGNMFIKHIPMPGF
jgi:ribonuclease BN (tRNA processing enzyme)